MGWLGSVEGGEYDQRKPRAESNPVAFGRAALSSAMRVWAERTDGGENKRDRGVIQPSK